jgi:hypothetical protein
MASCETDRSGICIARKRGDTAPDKIFVLDPEISPVVALDVTGFGFKMTVNTEEDPDPGVPIGVELVSIVGSITDGPAGEVEFPWSAGDADQEPEEYFYDIEQTDTAGKILTIAKERYIFQQDVTK